MSRSRRTEKFGSGTLQIKAWLRNVSKNQEEKGNQVISQGFKTRRWRTALGSMRKGQEWIGTVKGSRSVVNLEEFVSTCWKIVGTVALKGRGEWGIGLNVSRLKRCNARRGRGAKEESCVLASTTERQIRLSLQHSLNCHYEPRKHRCLFICLTLSS